MAGHGLWRDAVGSLRLCCGTSGSDGQARVCEKNLPGRLRRIRAVVPDERVWWEKGKPMAEVTLTITLPDIEAEALSMLIASLGAEQFEDAYQHWLSHGKAHETYNPHVEMNTTDLMSEATEKLYTALAAAGFDAVARRGPR
jgi:hypothetical protein